MINRPPILITSTFLLLYIPLAAGASTLEGRSIRGHVRTGAGVDMPWIIVDLLTSNGASAGLAVTNNEGAFSFDGLNGTSYVIAITVADYEPVKERVDFSGRSERDMPAETLSVEIKLTPRSNASPPHPRPAFTQNVPEAARAVYDRAMRMGRAGKKQVANVLMQEAVRMFPAYFDAHFALSSEMLMAGRFNDAIVELDLARTINPNDDRVYQLFGVTLIGLKRYDLAAAIFAEAFHLNQTEPLHLLMRGSALIDYASTIDPAASKSAAIERYDALNEAEKSLTRAYNLSDKQLAAVHLQMALLDEMKGENARAADELEQYLLKNPTSKNADAIRDRIQKLRNASGNIKPSSPLRKN